MTDEERIALVKVKLRLLGVHPTWIEHLLTNHGLAWTEEWAGSMERGLATEDRMFKDYVLPTFVQPKRY